jgi:predicted AAA+ superfamily ATPase
MQRKSYLNEIIQALSDNPIVALLGPRQCGKTTLAHQLYEYTNLNPITYFDLENPVDLARLTEPFLALMPLTGLVIIDEIQLSPNLFPILRVLVDQKADLKLLILGSASRELLKQSSESLAGRIQYIEISPFSYSEVNEFPKLWIRGGFPRSFLATTENASVTWRKNYIRTFMEQDIPNLGFKIPPANIRRFWLMLAHYHAQLFNASELGNSLNLTHHTVKHYLDILAGTFMVRVLNPWFENISKRQVKSSKIYLRDSGIYHTLLNINKENELLINPKLGASWEGFALESVIKALGVDSNDCYFWSTHSHAELDLLIVEGLDRRGFEFKYNQAPKITPSMRIALHDLKLEKLVVIYPGTTRYALAPNIECIGLEMFCTS